MNRLTLFREMMSACCEKRTEHTDTLCGQDAGGTYTGACALTEISKA
jgi:hypothetical protein